MNAFLDSKSTFLELRNRYTIRMGLESDGSLHIGSGIANSETDSPFILQGGKPFLPGSTLRGVMRSTVERMARALWPGRTCVLFAGDELNEGVACANAKEEVKKQWLKDTGAMVKDLKKIQLCPVCRLFGSELMAARLKVSDCRLVSPAQKVVRDGIGIDRDTGAARNKIKFDYEAVENGRFEVKLQIENADTSDFSLLYLLFSEWKREGLAVGGKRSSGLGVLQWRDPEVMFFDDLPRMLEEGERAMDWPVLDGILRKAFQEVRNVAQ